MHEWITLSFSEPKHFISIKVFSLLYFTYLEGIDELNMIFLMSLWSKLISLFTVIMLAGG